MVTQLVARISYNRYPGTWARQRDLSAFRRILPGASPRAAPSYQKHPHHPPCPTLAAKLSMHPGMADSAERDEVLRIVVCRVAVEVVNVEFISPAADRTPILIALKYGAPNLLPCREAILVPGPDGSLEPLAVDEASVPHGKRAPAAEPAKAVSGRIVSAEGRI